jgi:hypothetical protein
MPPQPVAATPMVACPVCRAPLPYGLPQCGACGSVLQYQVQPNPQGMPLALPYGPTTVRQPTNAAMIASMWVLSVVAWLVSLSGIPPVSYIIDAGTIIMAIMLVCTNNNTNRANGWVKIGLELLGFVAAFVAAAVLSARQSI